MPEKFIRICTHEEPDIDGLVGMWILKRFGEMKFPGVKDAEIGFVSAGDEVDGKSGDQLFEEGVILVDTGGGIFDHHVRDTGAKEERLDDCTTTLAAKHVGVANDKALAKLLRWVKRHDLEGKGLSSKDPAEHLIALPNIITGLNLICEGEYVKTWETVATILDAIYATEVDWFKAVEDVSHGYCVKLEGGLSVIAVLSDSRKIMKAARYLQHDLIIAQDNQNRIGITPKIQPNLSEVDFSRLVEALRKLECNMRGIEFERLESQIGEKFYWFLHDSRRIVASGSRKNTKAQPTIIPRNLICEVTARVFDPEFRFSKEFEFAEEIIA
ncbi:MAG: hypothetical protein NUW37_00280 [Planctomycetes bacterium]|nr:hypothetical protein [Planctomycetota bacterium]